MQASMQAYDQVRLAIVAESAIVLALNCGSWSLQPETRASMPAGSQPCMHVGVPDLVHAGDAQVCLLSASEMATMLPPHTWDVDADVKPLPSVLLSSPVSTPTPAHVHGALLSRGASMDVQQPLQMMPVAAAAQVSSKQPSYATAVIVLLYVQTRTEQNRTPSTILLIS